MAGVKVRHPWTSPQAYMHCLRLFGCLWESGRGGGITHTPPWTLVRPRGSVGFRVGSPLLSCQLRFLVLGYRWDSSTVKLSATTSTWASVREDIGAFLHTNDSARLGKGSANYTQSTWKHSYSDIFSSAMIVCGRWQGRDTPHLQSDHHQRSFLCELHEVVCYLV